MLSCSHFNLRNPKTSCSTKLLLLLLLLLLRYYYYYNTSDYLRYLRIKRHVTVILNLQTKSEKYHRTILRNAEFVHLIEIEGILFFSQCWRLWKEPAVVWGNLNVRQATSQQVFKVITFCMHGHRLPVFLPLISRIINHALLKFSQCLNKPLPQLVRIADWYSIHAFASWLRCGNLPDLDQDCWLECFKAQKLDSVSSAMC